MVTVIVCFSNSTLFNDYIRASHEVVSLLQRELVSSITVDRGMQQPAQRSLLSLLCLSMLLFMLLFVLALQLPLVTSLLLVLIAATAITAIVATALCCNK
jgi:uncharacterized membrane-anchored protein